jgi:single-stranded DNA-binding protein
VLLNEKLVEIVEKYVKKGSKLHIEGKLEPANTARTEATGG